MPETMPTVADRSGRWQRWGDRLARPGWVILVISGIVAVIGGVIYAAWPPAADAEPIPVEECVNPPCFGGGGLPPVSDLPAVVPVLGYVLAILLGLPSALAGGWWLLHTRWAASGRRLLVFIGPVALLIGTEVVPHLVNPCLLADALGGTRSGLCQHTPDGVDVADRWDPLDHALAGAVPMLGLYWLALRRWRPEVVERFWGR